jgi:queuine tRNA-ribosyltransferase
VRYRAADDRGATGRRRLFTASPPVVSFVVEATDGAARAGVIRTAHGEIATPAFMPVGTKGTVKTLHPDEVRALGAQVVLGNAYHLHLRPGEDVIEELGGLHAFSGWSGPILTDSGGFQVFSLRDTLLAVDDDGVTFRSVYDGQAERFTPERVAEIQRRLGSDIAMCLDICPPADSSLREHEDAVRRTTLWAERQVNAPRAPGQLRFGIAQGGADTELRTRSIEEVTALPFDGFALGGLAVGESRELMLDTVGWAAPALPAERPRYFMGLGDAEGILEVIARGIDMFDCVLPTRTARTGSALTAGGRLNLRNARYARDPRPLEEGCGCPACERFSRAFVRHLVNQQELLGLRLLTLHNLFFTLRLTAGARDAITRGGFDAYRRDVRASLAAGPKEEPWQA